jgi:L,D-transpeptidase-like protein
VRGIRKSTAAISFWTAGILGGGLSLINPHSAIAGTKAPTVALKASSQTAYPHFGSTRNIPKDLDAPSAGQYLPPQFSVDAQSQADTVNDSAKIAAHLMGDLPPELYENFDLFIYVSKAEEGPLAQHMYVFAKERGGPDANLIPMNDWPVSTGRETVERAKNGERVSTGTPPGFYELDPGRLFVQYRSNQWQIDMPNAMFLNWSNRGYQTGLAIHGVSDADDIAALGRRASAGCVQLPLQASRELFDLVRDNFEGQVPLFAYDKKTRTTNNKGELARDKDGNLVMADGYRVLVIIENYGGEDETPEVSMDSYNPPG